MRKEEDAVTHRKEKREERENGKELDRAYSIKVCLSGSLFRTMTFIIMFWTLSKIILLSRLTATTTFAYAMIARNKNQPLPLSLPVVLLSQLYSSSYIGYSPPVCLDCRLFLFIHIRSACLFACGHIIL